MKKILIFCIFIIIVNGCYYGKEPYNQYVVINKTQEITIETPQTILNILDTDKKHASTMGPLSSSLIWATYGPEIEILKIEKAITIHYTYKGDLGLDYMPSINVYLCKNKETRVEVINVIKSSAIDKKIMKPGAIVLTPDLMREKNLLNDDNTVKGDLCFEAIINIGHIREKDDQHFVVTKEEMDRAIVEYENF